MTYHYTWASYTGFCGTDSYPTLQAKQLYLITITEIDIVSKCTHQLLFLSLQSIPVSREVSLSSVQLTLLLFHLLCTQKKTEKVDPQQCSSPTP